jgi:hypothetical protein
METGRFVATPTVASGSRPPLTTFPAEGMHKHFRMIAISEFMKSQGYAPSHAEHTRIPGIWKKLGTLYNLPALDERVRGTGAQFHPLLLTFNLHNVGRLPNSRYFR